MRLNPTRKIRFSLVVRVLLVFAAGAFLIWLSFAEKKPRGDGYLAHDASLPGSPSSASLLAPSSSAGGNPERVSLLPASPSPLIPDGTISETARSGTAETALLQDREKVKSIIEQDATMSEKPPEALQPESERLTRDAGKLLDALRKALVRSELMRCQFETKAFEEAVYAKVVISRPSASEVQEFRQRLESGAGEVAEEVRPYYLVDGQRLLDRYLQFPHSHLVLLLGSPNYSRLVFKPDEDAFEMLDEFGSYSVFSTEDPSGYGIHDEMPQDQNRFLVPEEARGNLKTKPWFDGTSQPARFRHLFKKLHIEL